MRDLLEEILKGKFLVPPEISRVNRPDIIGPLQSAVAIDATNVHEWKLTDKHTWKDRLPQLPPRIPFPTIWVEWTEMVQEHQHFTQYPMGVLVEEDPCWGTDSENDDDHPDWYSQHLTIFMQISSRNVIAAQVDEDWEEDGRTYHVYSPDPARSDESYVGDSLPDKIKKNEDASIDISDWAAVRALETFLPLLIFMNCRNVTVNQLIRPARSQKKFQKRYHVSRPSFHVIEVHKTMVRNVYEQGIATETVMHAHMVRGHVKQYGEHNKLFGKIAGSWFWQSHVRGDIGVPAVSDYRVWGPSKDHKRHCRVTQ